MQAHHIPNLISTARIALVYPIILLLLHREFSWALSLMVVAGLTDALDGWLARHYHWQSKLGSWLDPAADKLLLVTGYVALASLNLLPVWLAVAVIVRDILILVGAGAFYYRVGPFAGQPLPISKINTFLQLVLLITVIQAQTLWAPPYALLNILTLTVLISTVISGVCYVYVWGRKYYRHLIHPHNPLQESSMTDSRIQHRFLRIGIITIIALYFLIAVGGIVRASGAGMGCPDWPTCFGQWIPPTEESQLPANYHQIYAERGYADTHFNPVKTWTEYLNRLAGASIGILVILTLLYSIPFLKQDKRVFYLSGTVFLLVGFQGWLGSAVVASNLRPVMITAHMVTAFIIVSLLIYTLARSQKDRLEKLNLNPLPARYKTVLTVALGMTLLQIAMGTQIRESVDVIASHLGPETRDVWREQFPIIFYIHRSFSSLILFTNLWLVWTLLRHQGLQNLTGRFGVGLMILIVIAIGSGVTLDRLGFPAFIQPLHLVLANLIFGTQFFLWVTLGYARPAHTV